MHAFRQAHRPEHAWMEGEETRGCVTAQLVRGLTALVKHEGAFLSAGLTGGFSDHECVWLCLCLCLCILCCLRRVGQAFALIFAARSEELELLHRSVDDTRLAQGPRCDKCGNTVAQAALVLVACCSRVGEVCFSRRSVGGSEPELGPCACPGPILSLLLCVLAFLPPRQVVAVLANYSDAVEELTLILLGYAQVGLRAACGVVHRLLVAFGRSRARRTRKRVREV